MIRSKLPIFQYQYDEEKKQVISQRKDIDVLIDTSIFSQQRWEAHFPLLAEKETLQAHLERVKKINAKGLDIPKIISILKVLFCFIDSNEFSTFEDFSKAFSIPNTNDLEILINKIKDIFEAIVNSSAVKSKN